MCKFCLVIVESMEFDYVSDFRRAFLALGIEAEIVRIPFLMIDDLSLDRIESIIGILKEKAQNKFVIFCPGTAEWFLKPACLTVAFSHYRKWHERRKVLVIPHVWTINEPETLANVQWHDKPPLRIGFMGSTYETSRVGRAVSRLPTIIRRVILRGDYLRHIRLYTLLNQLGIPLKYLNTFVRPETFSVLHSKRAAGDNADIQIVDTRGFARSGDEKERFKKHLEAMTYIICPRGIENFSIRVYEALKYGRIPVIIDSDMVFPEGIDWDAISIRIPYERIGEVYDLILQDYRSRSADEFIARQNDAFSSS